MNSFGLVAFILATCRASALPNEPAVDFIWPPPPVAEATLLQWVPLALIWVCALLMYGALRRRARRWHAASMVILALAGVIGWIVWLYASIVYPDAGLGGRAYSSVYSIGVGYMTVYAVLLAVLQIISFALLVLKAPLIIPRVSLTVATVLNVVMAMMWIGLTYAAGNCL